MSDRLLEPGLLVESGNSLSFVFVDFEDLLQLHQIEYFLDVRVDVADSQINTGGIALFPEQDQLADHCRRHEIDIFQIDQDLVLIPLLNQIDQFLAQALNGRFVNNPDVLEIDQ